MLIQEPDGDTAFSYNHADLVTSVTYKSGVSNYFYYDSMLRRYALEDSNGLRYFVWDSNGSDLLLEQDIDGNATAQYSQGYTPIPGIGSMVSAQKEVDGTTYFQYASYDHRGSVYKLTDENGNVTHSDEYNAWGQKLESSTNGVSTKFGWQSNWQELSDSGGELLISPARIYSSNAGRFIQRDALPKVQMLGNLGIYWNSIFERELIIGLLHQNFPSHNLYFAFNNNSLIHVDIFGNYIIRMEIRPEGTQRREGANITNKQGETIGVHYRFNPSFYGHRKWVHTNLEKALRYYAENRSSEPLDIRFGAHRRSGFVLEMLGILDGVVANLRDEGIEIDIRSIFMKSCWSCFGLHNALSDSNEFTPTEIIFDSLEADHLIVVTKQTKSRPVKYVKNKSGEYVEVDDSDLLHMNLTDTQGFYSALVYTKNNERIEISKRVVASPAYEKEKDGNTKNYGIFSYFDMLSRLQHRETIYYQGRQENEITVRIRDRRCRRRNVKISSRYIAPFYEGVEVYVENERLEITTTNDLRLLVENAFGQ